MKKPLMWLTAALASCAMAGVGHAANLIVNGDFSTPNVGSGFGDFASIPGWTSNTGDSLEVGSSPIYGLSCYTTACQNLEVNANTFGSVSQTVTLTAGEKYTLSWVYGGRNAGGPQQLDVLFGGALVGVDNSNGVTASWTPNSVTLVATSSSETLTFTSVDVGGSPSFGNELTGVSLSAVPEPASWALMLIGAAATGAGLRRRRGTLARA